MTATVLSEITVGLTPEIEAGLRAAVQRQGIKASQYARQSIFLRLVAEGYLEQPEIVRPPINGAIKSRASAVNSEN
jgi:hypothetical protein